MTYHKITNLTTGEIYHYPTDKFTMNSALIQVAHKYAGWVSMVRYEGIEEIPSPKPATYGIYLNGKSIALVSGCECAYEVWRAARQLAVILNQRAALVYNATGEIIEDYDPEE